MTDRPVRVLHLIDGLGGGGSERWIWELVRLADTSRVRHKVLPIHPDLGRFVYADRLRQAGAFGLSQSEPRPLPAIEKRPAVRSGRVAESVAKTMRLAPRPAIAALRRIWLVVAVAPLATARVAHELIRYVPDLIHAHTFHALRAALLVRRIMSCPLVYTVPSFFSHIKANGYGWVLETYKRQHSQIDRFITNYPRELEQIGVAPAKILTVRGMVDVAEIDRSASLRGEIRASIRMALKIDANAPLAISAGRLDAEKGYEFGIEALPAILHQQPNLHWVILGSGPLRSELEERAAVLGVSSSVHLMGFVDDPLPWYLAADIYLRTHVLEGDNLSSVQAMAAGLPVIGFDTRSEAELVPTVGHGRLVENRNVAAFAAAVAEMLVSRQRHATGAAGATYAATHLSSTSVVRRCELMYAELAGIDELTARRVPSRNG